MFETKLVEKIKTHILCSVSLFFFENRAVYEIMWEKYERAGLCNTAHAFYVLDNYGYRQKLGIRNTSCFCMNMPTLTRLTLTFYVHCLPFIIY
jgi:hypothetical protein